MKFSVTIATLFLLILTGCRDDSVKHDIVVKDDVITTEKPEDDGHDHNEDLADGEVKSNVELIAIDEPAIIPNAKLKTINPANEAQLNDGKVNVSYSVDGFDLGTETDLKTDYDLAESEKGQHIHAIINNEPYMAHYEPSFSKELPEGQYLMMSFLSRSYHLSLKQREASDLISFTVGNPAEEPYDTEKPYLFYSRPKGSYNIGKNEDILLDFYLHNCDLSENGFRIKAKIAGYDFMIDSWQPYVIKGLGEGLHTVKLEMIDGNGNTVDSPFNPVSRNINVTSEVNTL